MSGELGSGHWYRGEVVVNLNASDNASGVARLEYSMDGGSWQAWAEAFSVTNEGTHTLLLRSADLAGNEEEILKVEWGIDNTPPTLSVNASIQHSTDGAYLLQWQDEDSLSSASVAQVLVDGRPVGTITGSHQLRLEGLTDGRHNVTVVARDGSGNLAQSSIEVTVDTNPLSPGGPFGPWLLVVLIAVGAGCTAAVIAIKRRHSK